MSTSDLINQVIAEKLECDIDDINPIIGIRNEYIMQETMYAHIEVEDFPDDEDAYELNWMRENLDVEWCQSAVDYAE